MNPRRNSHLGILTGILVVISLIALIYFKAKQNYQYQDYTNSNFFSFWLAGRMAWTGQNPYNTSQWLAGFDAFGATYKPSQILQYPLPLMYIMAPLGLLSVGKAYFVWQIICQVIIAVTVFAFLRHAGAPGFLFLPLMISLLFFGPVYLSLQVGSVGVLSLAAIALTILLEEEKPLLAGMAFSLTMLKPPQALPLLILTGIWFLSKKELKLIAGILIGGMLLLILWMFRDPLGLFKFRNSSDLLLGHTLGVQSNVYGFSYGVCHQDLGCMWIVGSIAALILLTVGVWYLLRNHERLTTWEAFNLIIPLGFVSAVYLWSYDQLLYLVPIIWISARLLERTRSYVPVLLFLIVVDVVSFIALAVQATNHQDLLSITTTLLVVGLSLWLVQGHPQTSSPTLLSS